MQVRSDCHGGNHTAVFWGEGFGGRKNLGNSRLFRHFWEIPPNSDQKFVDVAMAAMWVV